MSNSTHICRVCESKGEHRELLVREMQFGTREVFPYFLCGDCGCAQISQVPADLGRHYPKDYYSFAPFFSGPRRVFYGGLRFFAPIVRRLLFSENAILGFPRRAMAKLNFGFIVVDMLSHAKLTRKASILDVGCGSGSIAYCFKQAGFRRVLGLDLFIERDLSYRNGLQILKQGLIPFRESTEERFDLIMFHHSLEHMERHDEVLKAAADLLTPEGRILVRIPLIDCVPFDEYQENLFALDAPRHLIVHSRRSFEITARRAGLEVERIVFDSNLEQFWASEQYRRDIPYTSERSYYVNKRHSIFSVRELREFARRAARLNREGRGDRAGFFLRKPAAAQPLLEKAMRTRTGT